MLQEKISSRLRFLHYLKEVIFFFRRYQTHLPKIGAPMSWNAGYIADKIPETIALSPKSLTKNTRKDKTMLKPRVPIKLISNIEKSWTWLCEFGTPTAFLRKFMVYCSYLLSFVTRNIIQIMGVFYYQLLSRKLHKRAPLFISEVNSSGFIPWLSQVCCVMSLNSSDSLMIDQHEDASCLSINIISRII